MNHDQDPPTAPKAPPGTAPNWTGRRRVAITGMGVKTPAGCDLTTFADTVFAGRPTAAKVTRFDASTLPTRIACEVHDFDPTAYATGKALRRMDRFTQMGLGAALDAYTDAGSPTIAPERAAIAFGTCIAGIDIAYDMVKVAEHSGPQFVSPFFGSMQMPSAPVAYIGLELGWHGPSITVSSACATGADAIATGAQMIRDGRADLVLAGASDTGGVSPLHMGSFCSSGALSTRNHDPATASRPFDTHRDGYVMGEGAAFLLLEDYDRALARGARIHGEISGYARTTDSHHITAPHPRGRWTALCMTQAITDAGLVPADIAQVNCHATATPLGDAAEAQALLTAFNGAPPPATGTKGVFGHLIGAAGAAEAVVAVLSAGRGLVPPTAGFQELGADCAGIDVVAGPARPVGMGPVLTNSFGVGGQNAALVIKPPTLQEAR
ncbi:beta-ketoacyl-[acyl-carrier-protein] synthase family protein [Streptomyces sp. cmx-4-9]|uniref:beta-ketoacyl-[acyl-carrier-protein] synthase family protein n=1 Tax=Streptomyces sp. cmx-4-9 TaxID=2790941 RepID=UPI0039809B51